MARSPPASAAAARSRHVIRSVSVRLRWAKVTPRGSTSETRQPPVSALLGRGVAVEVVALKEMEAAHANP